MNETLHISGDVRRNSTEGEIVAKVSAVITLTAVPANAPPQYTGPASINDLVVGVGRQLQGFDPDGDTITWSVAAADATKISVSAGGVLTALQPLSNAAVTIELDDGK